MGVYIKDMEMPARCEDCFCFRHNAEYDYAYCIISSVKVLGHGNARLNNCPLAPVPPHGRLIDADALRAKQQEDADLFQGSTAYGDKCRRDEAMNAVANIVNAPTIIPASGGKEDE